MPSNPQSNNQPSTDNALELRNINFRVSKSFALQDISFDVARGRMCMLLGANGAGKSTLFSIASGLFHADKGGSVVMGGYDLYKTPRLALAQLGVVFQQSTLDLDLTVKQNLLYHASLHGMSKSEALNRVAKDLEHNKLSQYLNTKTSSLSGGERRRVELVRALMHDPSILLMDEATSGLDISRRLAFIEDVRALCLERKVGVLWATHLGDEVAEADDVVVLHEGKIVEKGSAADLIAQVKSKTVEELYAELIAKVV